jgi:hypothetical protein
MVFPIGLRQLARTPSTSDPGPYLDGLAGFQDYDLYRIEVVTSNPCPHELPLAAMRPEEVASRSALWSEGSSCFTPRRPLGAMSLFSRRSRAIRPEGRGAKFRENPFPGSYAFFASAASLRCLAQRRLCACAIRLRASALSTRFLGALEARLRTLPFKKLLLALALNSSLTRSSLVISSPIDCRI